MWSACDASPEVTQRPSIILQGSQRERCDSQCARKSASVHSTKPKCDPAWHKTETTLRPSTPPHAPAWSCVAPPELAMLLPTGSMCSLVQAHMQHRQLTRPVDSMASSCLARWHAGPLAVIYSSPRSALQATIAHLAADQLAAVHALHASVGHCRTRILLCSQLAATKHDDSELGDWQLAVHADALRRPMFLWCLK